MSFNLEKAWLQIKDLAGDIAAATSETDKRQYNASLEVWKKAMTYTDKDEMEEEEEDDNKKTD